MFSNVIDKTFQILLMFAMSVCIGMLGLLGYAMFKILQAGGL